MQNGKLICNYCYQTVIDVYYLAMLCVPVRSSPVAGTEGIAYSNLQDKNIKPMRADAPNLPTAIHQSSIPRMLFMRLRPTPLGIYLETDTISSAETLQCFSEPFMCELQLNCLHVQFPHASIGVGHLESLLWTGICQVISLPMRRTCYSLSIMIGLVQWGIPINDRWIAHPSLRFFASDTTTGLALFTHRYSRSGKQEMLH